MKSTFTLFLCLAFSAWTLAQSPITSADVVPTIGDSWHVIFSTGGNEAFDVDLGNPGANSLFDFSAYGETTDLFSGNMVSEVNETNATSNIEIIDGTDLENVPSVFESADYYLDYKEEGGAHWQMPFEITDDGLNVMGEMAITGASTPPTWIYYYGTHFGPGRNFPFDIALGDSVVMERYVLDERVDRNDSVHIVDVYVFDAEGTYVSPHGETFTDVCRLRHASNIDIYSKDNDEWNLADNVYQEFTEYRKRGYQLPLAEFGTDLYYSNGGQVVSSWEVTADFFVPNFVISSVEKNSIQLQAEVSPNPAQERIAITFPNEIQIVNINWIDKLGRMVKSEAVNDNRLDYLHLVTPEESGIYFLQIQAKEGNLVKKIQVE